MIGRGRIKASRCFTDSPSGLINEPVSCERNADSQEEIDPRHAWPSCRRRVDQGALSLKFGPFLQRRPAHTANLHECR
jgi:hypothetical protein